ncbi:zinc ribbon domain-containing protein [Desulfonatronospira sp.]|uniref:FmdB family zinc ribbon protein n=1 Tax=Desulfonatronospira sp. TaxID=1962951 RepID=UPI0025B85E05|nr:zinc ribbon domain-containing protein [Desulfonatronospira sp.]
MPIYEYYCPDCEKVFEELVKGQPERVACPGCKKDVTSNRCMSAAASFSRRDSAGMPDSAAGPSCSPASGPT